jgi:hypothetical protein
MQRIVMKTFLAASLFIVPSLFAAKLKGIYSGSGGLSQEVHRTVMIEFGEDGTALIQQNWTEKDPQVWHGRWTQDKDQVKIVFDPVKDQKAPDPLLMEMKRSTLTPTSWDAAAMGVLGPPKLAPFGGKNVKQHSVATCQSMNTRDPSQNCVTWSSNSR